MQVNNVAVTLQLYLFCMNSNENHTHSATHFFINNPKFHSLFLQYLPTNMRPSSTSLFLIFLCFLDFTIADQKTWCVAKPSSDDATLLENINFACAHVDCSVMRKGCPCYSPDNLMNHASIAMNLYYQCKGRNHWNCHFGNSAIVVLTDPSYGGCTYE